MRRTLMTAAAVLVAVGALAQVKTPRLSPGAEVTQTVGTTDISIKYSRPGVKGRTIWGGLVPYEKVWRTGANEATTISFSEDVWVNGQKVAKGRYSIETIPGPEEWTVIFNKVPDQWGAFSYDESKDALRIQVKPEAAPYREWMTFEIPEMTTDTAKVVLRWEKLAVPFTVDTKSVERTMTQLRNAMKPDWRTPYQAASFAFDNKSAATDEEMKAWLEQSIKVSPNASNLWLKARIFAREGHKVDAVRIGQMAIAAATPAQKNLAEEIQKDVDSWKK